MKFVKKAVLFIMAAVMILGIAACGSRAPSKTTSSAYNTGIPALDEIKTAGRLVVGTSADNPPFTFHKKIDGKDTIVGFDMSFAKYLADTMGVELEIVVMPFDRLFKSLENGKIDFAMAAISKTEERMKVVDFSDSYFHNTQVVVIRNDENAKNYTNTDSFRGLKLGVKSGSAQEAIAADFTDETNIIKLSKCQELIEQLKAGEIEGFCTDRLVAIAYSSSDDDLIIRDIGIKGDNAGYAIAIQKDNGIMEYLNTLLYKAKFDGFFDIYAKEAEELSREE